MRPPPPPEQPLKPDEFTLQIASELKSKISSFYLDDRVDDKGDPVKPEVIKKALLKELAECDKR